MRSSPVLLRNLLVETKDGEWGKGEPFDGSVEMAVIRGTDFDTAKQSQLSGVPVRYIPIKAAGRKTLKPFDILIETAGGSKGKPTGKTTFLRPALFERSDLPITCASFARFLRIDPALADPEFVYWYLQNLYFSGVVENYQVQHTGIARFQFTKFADSIEIELPSIGDQKKIAEFFGSIDDRITLLRETNATLEAIAQALFKSWFVDFDPVRAKAEGRQPEGMDAATATLFPDSFEESELGMVPRGWKVFSLGEVAVVKGGKQLEKECFTENGKNPVFGGAGVMGRSDFNNASGFVITVGRVGAYCGQFFWHIGGAWVNNNASQILPSGEFSPMWLYEFLRTTDIESIKKGAAQPFVSNGDLANLKMALPAPNIVRCFSDFADPIYQRMHSLQLQAQTLTQLRDTLLPRLISGQLRLPEAEELVEEMSA